MASVYPVIRLFITSYAKDFSKEREILLKEVVPHLKAWCEGRQLQLVETEVRWGGSGHRVSVAAILEEISQCYFNNIMPFFINITSDTLGMVPMWGEATESVIEEYQKRLKLSTTEMELLFGAYREDNHNGLFVVREDSFLDSPLLEEERKFFVRRELLPKKLRKMTHQLLEKYPEERVLHYNYDSAGYIHGEQKIQIEISSSFANQVSQFVKLRLSQDFPMEEAITDVYYSMREAQESFMKARSHRLRGRDDIIHQIEQYVFTGGKDVPLILLGGAGSGKSSIMARTADLMVTKAAAGLIPGGADTGWHVFYHYVGAVPRSTELEFMLKRLIKELDIVPESALPADLDATAQLCCNALSNTNTRPVILFVDAVNQFDEDHAALVMSWVPRKLSPKVRCTLSMINDTAQHTTLMARESKPQELHMTPLDFDSRRQIVQEMLRQYQRQLTEEQLNRLLCKQTSENPLWLSVACEELRLVQHPSQLDQCIHDLPNGLLNLLEKVLERFEQEHGATLLVATLCLLEVSAAGLLESELLAMLGDKDTLIPPSPFDEKDEKECSEKESSSKKRQKRPLSREKWCQVFRALRPFLRPYGDSREGRLDFYHRALSKAVRRKYLKQRDDNEEDDEAMEICAFWHGRLADYFESCPNIDRKAEEYSYHLCKIEDYGRLVQCLVDWAIFDKLYHEEYSTQLLAYWRKVGGANEMIREYKAALERLEEREPRDEELLATRYQHVAKIFLQAGKYSESLELTKIALKVEERELGKRHERMVELYGLMAEIYDEKLKLNDFVSVSQLPDLRKTISYGRKSIALRKQFSGDYHRYKLGLSLMKLAFSLESWEACGGDGNMSGLDALQEGNEHIDTALQIFKELRDDGHYAEALMTKGVLAKRGSMEQLKYYNEAMDICVQVYGEQALLTSRLYINIGIVYEDNKEYVKAYNYFKKWSIVSEQVLGPDHPKTLRAKGVLKELRYMLVANRLNEQDDHTGQNDPNNSLDENGINHEVDNLEESDEDHYSPAAVTEAWGDDVEEDIENSDNIDMDFFAVTDDLQQAINELLRQTGRDDPRQAFPIWTAGNHGSAVSGESDNRDGAHQQSDSTAAHIPANNSSNVDNRDLENAHQDNSHTHHPDTPASRSNRRDTHTDL